MRMFGRLGRPPPEVDAPASRSANGPRCSIAGVLGGCMSWPIVEPRALRRAAVATILCGSNTTTEDFARWVLGDG